LLKEAVASEIVYVSYPKISCHSCGC